MDWRPHITKQWNLDQPIFTWLNGKKKLVLKISDKGGTHWLYCNNEKPYDRDMINTVEFEKILEAFQWLQDDSRN